MLGPLSRIPIVSTQARRYQPDPDYDRVGALLLRTYGFGGPHANWLQPRWEYMHFHPYVRRVDLGTIGVWEHGDRIVGVVHPELDPGQAFFQIDPDHDELREAMLDHAEEHLAVDAEGARELSIFVSDEDVRLQDLAADRGYVRTDVTEPMTRWPLPDPFPPIVLPEGFRLQSLADEDDLGKVDRVLWRGFDHGEEPPEGDLEDRRFMESAPGFRHELNVVVVAPRGEYASYAGTWFEPVHGIAYVEPVATDPLYRRRGLARAAVLEALRRCASLGATVAYVGSTLPIYRSLGFREIARTSVWRLRRPA